MFHLTHRVLYRVHKEVFKSEKIIKSFWSLNSSREIAKNSNIQYQLFPFTNNLQCKWLREKPQKSTLAASLFTLDNNIPNLNGFSGSPRQWNVKTFVSKPITTGLVEEGFPKRLESVGAWKDWKILLRAYLKLSKHRLSALVVFTAMVGYYMGCRGEAEERRSIYHPVVLMVGTMLCAASANAWNQLREIEKDAKMQRTKLRPLPSGLLSKRHAAIFTILTGIFGVSILLGLPDHGIAAALGGSNIILYANIYTPLKVIHPINTWVGALVGAIPPMMGWSAARQGDIASSGSLLLAGYLFLWQIPHFHSLAVMCCKDYLAGGYKMLAQSNPRANAIWSVITCLGLLCLGPLAVHMNMTSSWFGYESSALGLWMLHRCTDLVKDPANPQVARVLFKVSIVYLPSLLGLMCLHRMEKTPSNNALPIGRQERKTPKDLKMARRRRVVYYPASYYYASFPFLPPAMLPPVVVFEEDKDETNNCPENEKM